MSEPTITVESLQLTAIEAAAFARLLSRLRRSGDLRVLARNAEECELMREACAKVLRAFADVGVASPR